MIGSWPRVRTKSPVSPSHSKYHSERVTWPKPESLQKYCLRRRNQRGNELISLDKSTAEVQLKSYHSLIFRRCPQQHTWQISRCNYLRLKLHSVGIGTSTTKLPFTPWPNLPIHLTCPRNDFVKCTIVVYTYQSECLGLFTRKERKW